MPCSLFCVWHGLTVWRFHLWPFFAVMQMNALLEPWDDGAESADLTWGLPQQLAGAVAADTEADTATSGMRAAAADKLQAAKDSMDSAAIAAATDAYNRAMDQPALPLGSGLFYGPAKSFDLQPIHRGTTVSCCTSVGHGRFPSVACILVDIEAVKRHLLLHLLHIPLPHIPSAIRGEVRGEADTRAVSTSPHTLFLIADGMSGRGMLQWCLAGLGLCPAR